MYRKYIKRIIDLVFAFIMLFVFAPLMIVIMIAIKIYDPNGPVFFKQKRPGKNGKLFTIYKFRTMKIQTEISKNKISDIERITKVGKILRKYSIDELPQLFNIIKGDMSFIGPRPLLVEYLPFYSSKEMRRHDVLPGITGLAQVSGRNAISWEEKFKYDLEYVDNVSFLLDVKIFVKTIIKVLKKEGVNNSENETMPCFIKTN